MPAATVTNTKCLARMLKRIEGGLRNFDDGTVPVLGCGMEFCFGDSFTIPTTSLDDIGDIQRLYQFPAGSYITDLRATPSDMDTHATPALTYDLLVIDSADTTKVTLVTASANGQAAAGSDRILNAAVGKFVGDFWLAMKIAAAAATPAAGTLKVFVKFAIGIFNVDGGNKPRMTDAAI